jgi:guanine deaminase
MAPKVFYGSIVHSISSQELEIIENGTLIVDADGVIVALKKLSDENVSVPDDAEIFHLATGEILIPGFVDTHNHAPQWPMRGLGQGLHILEWLEQVTFPVEARFADTEYARKTYENTVCDFLRQGITTASYYGSRHAEATRILAEICLEKGQRAFVGK